MKAAPMSIIETKNKTRLGRPPMIEAGLAEERVLDAATALFLERGFGRTTLDKVSQISKTGKSALYRRYPDKAALFAAVVRRSINTMFDEIQPIPFSRDVQNQLRHIGVELARHLLIPRCIALMRMTAAEAVNFPELAKMAYQVSFDGSVQCVLAVLNAEGGKVVRAAEVAKRFVELVLQPISFQAAFGEEIDVLQQRCAADVEDAIILLEAKGLLIAKN